MKYLADGFWDEVKTAGAKATAASATSVADAAKAAAKEDVKHPPMPMSNTKKVLLVGGAILAVVGLSAIFKKLG